MPRTFFILLTALLAIAPGACSAPGSAAGLRGNSVNVGGWPFVPTSMRIYPLTHIERGLAIPLPPSNPTGPSPADNIPPMDTVAAQKRSEVRLITHIDFRDAWGDSTKAIGAMTILLYGPGSSPNATPDPASVPEKSSSTQLRRYDIDLTDLKRNAELYDPATRTYRIPLAGLPDWITTATGPIKVTIRAEMKSPRSDGSSVLLVDEYVVTK